MKEHPGENSDAPIARVTRQPRHGVPAGQWKRSGRALSLFPFSLCAIFTYRDTLSGPAYTLIPVGVPFTARRQEAPTASSRLGASPKGANKL